MFLNIKQHGPHLSLIPGPTSEEEVSFGGLLPLLQTGVKEAQELQDPLLPA